VQICKPCTHIIIVQIMINRAFHHYLYTWNGFKIPCIDIQGWIMHYKKVFFLFFFLIEIQFDCKSKYIAHVLYNQKNLPLNKRLSQRWWITIIKYSHWKHYVSMYLLLLLLLLFRWNLNHNFFIPLYLLEICHIMIFNVTCEMGWITYT